MWSVGRWRPPSPPPCPDFFTDFGPRSRPASRSLTVLTPDSLGRALEAVTTSERSPPPLPLSCSNSTWSLLSPLGHHSFVFDEEDGDGEDEEAVDGEACDPPAQVESLRGLDLQGCASEVKSEDNREEQKQVHLPESRLTPWEVWFVGKEKEERDRLQQKALEELNEKLAKRKEMEEREKRKIIAEEKHKEWVQKKNKQEKEKQRQAELQEKKEIAEKKFKEWLENAKNKPRPAAKSYGYSSGKLTGFYSGNSYPEPAFCNPIPWKPIPMPPSKEAKELSGKKNKRPVTSQPPRSPALVIHKARNNLCLGTLCKIQR
ncbi:PREDICTED: coiled-coil domain-containing protein 34 isoform X3 [Dipodomys ordii]|uniref:Coiled-coil domain-containing protein 34 isoform X3 n=1 Tax=Dipodomys ordii TaxID=10020 RepID=A0A1S3FGB8_DIPOR|nr:PREDICTED: coiled-coil domain-containing protein 34 isoform X3 [Dipodomys ordii]